MVHTSPPALLAHKSTVQLYSQIAASKAITEEPNFVFSPHSIFSVFALAQIGARKDTLKQMNTILDPKSDNVVLPEIDPDTKADEVLIQSVNRIYISDKAKITNKKDYMNYLKAISLRIQGKEETSIADNNPLIETISFDDAGAAADHINQFVAEKTKNHIKDLVPASAIDVLTRMILVNALYFKSAWAIPFSIESTQQAIFHVPQADGTFGEKMVDFMESKPLSNGGSPPLYYEDEYIKACGLYYKDKTMIFYIFQSKTEHIHNLEARISQDVTFFDRIINLMHRNLRDRLNQALHLKMPKFKLPAQNNKYDMKALFRLLDVYDMFDMGSADFSGIPIKDDLYVSDFFHQADISVDEHGTEAAAASAMIMRTRMAMLRPEYIPVTIDHPFIFQLRWIHQFNNVESDHILFTGRISDPSTQ